LLVGDAEKKRFFELGVTDAADFAGVAAGVVAGVAAGVAAMICVLVKISHPPEVSEILAVVFIQ
jgi:hypothetical protein